MINEITNYRCKCNKCNHLWTTKTFDVPDKCPKCKRVTWNEGSPPATQIESVQAPQIAKPSDDTQTKLERARAALMSVEERVSVPVVEEVDDWKFTKAVPQFADNGNVYRQQFRVSNGKPVYRNVEVDCDDLDCIK